MRSVTVSTVEWARKRGDISKVLSMVLGCIEIKGTHRMHVEENNVFAKVKGRFSMDVVKVFRRFWWSVPSLLYLICLSVDLYSRGLRAFQQEIAMVVAIVQTFSTNIPLVRRGIRWLKYFLGFGHFRIDATATFEVVNVSRLSAQKFKQIVMGALHPYVKGDDKNVDCTTNKNGQLIIYCDYFSIYITVDLADADVTAEDGDVQWLTIRARTSLRFRTLREAINGFLIDLFSITRESFSSQSEKYVVKVAVEGTSNDFMKQQFVKEFEPKEIERFSIRVRKPRGFQEATQSDLRIETTRLDEISNAVSLLLKIS